MHSIARCDCKCCFTVATNSVVKKDSVHVSQLKQYSITRAANRTNLTSNIKPEFIHVDF
uniref:Uncharacterized protein n=1 Tax=Anguilla anguilla TaxID=7936 RepID=A0A0E9P543_ANGAN